MPTIIFSAKYSITGYVLFYLYKKYVFSTRCLYSDYKTLDFDMLHTLIVKYSTYGFYDYTAQTVLLSEIT